MSELAADLFGQETAEQLTSSEFKVRKEGLTAVYEFLDGDFKGQVKDHVLLVYSDVLVEAVDDKTLQNFTLSIEIVKRLFGSVTAKLSPDVVLPQAERLISKFLARTGDTTPRICTASNEILLWFAEQPNVGVEPVARAILSPIDNFTAWKKLINRLIVLQGLVEKYKFREGSALTLEGSLEIVRGCMTECKNRKVHQNAAAVVAEAWILKGKECEVHLQSLKPAMIKILKEEIQAHVTDADPFQTADVRANAEADIELLEAFSEDDQKKMKPLVDIFGEGIACIFSKKWKLRQGAIERLSEVLARGAIFDEYKMRWCKANGKSTDESTWTKQLRNLTKKVFLHTTQVLNIGLSDAVPTVYCAATGMIPSMIDIFRKPVSENDWKLCGEGFLKKLIDKTSDMNKVVAQASVESLLALAKCDRLGVGLIGTMTMQPIQNLSQQRIIMTRLELLGLLISTFGFSPGGLSIEMAMSFTVGMFESPSQKVRTAAIDVILEVYKQAGNVVRTYIRNQKPALVNEMTNKIMKVARKDRTKSAPIQRLANIVQPFGEDDDDSGPGSAATTPGARLTKDSSMGFGKEKERPVTFPSDLTAITSGGDLGDETTMSLKTKLKKKYLEENPDCEEAKFQREKKAIEEEREKAVAEKKPKRKGNMVFA